MTNDMTIQYAVKNHVSLTEYCTQLDMQQRDTENRKKIDKAFAEMKASNEMELYGDKPKKAVKNK